MIFFKRCFCKTELFFTAETCTWFNVTATSSTTESRHASVEVQLPTKAANGLSNGHLQTTPSNGVHKTSSKDTEYCEIDTSTETSTDPDDVDFSTAYSHVFFREYYGPFIVHHITRYCVLGLYVIYACIAAYGWSTLRQGLNPKHLVGDDQPFQPYVDFLAETIYRQGMVY